jgi:signal transduction histidine kinase
VGVALNDLLDALVADRARVRRLASEVIRAGDHERARLARELHDSTAQTLSALVMQLAAMTGEIRDPELAARFEAARASGLDALEEVRLLSQTVHPRVLDDLGLPAALRHLGREIERRAGILIEVDAATTSPLPSQIESTLYRVAQEGIANALRHGAPTEVRVRLAVDDRSATVEIRDNGAGFDAATAASNGAGLGIFSMRERVALVDGSFELVSRPGAGTCVRATIPVGAHSPRGP